MSESVVSPRIDALALGIQRRAAFLVRFFAAVWRPPFFTAEVLRQCYVVGVQSLPLITLSGFIIGLVFTKQSRPSLISFGAVSWLPSLVTIALVRSLAPLVTAMICAGKVGSGIGAELGSMRVTEQIDAMEVSASHPFRFLVVTRTVATTIMTPVLAVYCCFLGLCGSFANVHAKEATSLATFLDTGFATVTYLDVSSAFFKTIVYGFTIGFVGCFEGYHANGGTVGVGRAANTAVVAILFALFVEEALMVQIIGWIRGT